MARRITEYASLPLSGISAGDKERCAIDRARISGRGLCLRGPGRGRIYAGALYHRWRQHADLVQARRVEARIQLTDEIRGLFCQYQAVYRYEMGNVEPHYASRPGFRDRSASRFWSIEP